ncbi:hypothetical protein G5B38_10120 [Pseudohalocynthiibacter aestuariivivens]|uniref:Uncharacterized protein n=1 Tax=Roseovarius pelagicus TaxID=2980108 RepID=A0ABY6D7X1_9RHOB|nr:MULTISPECIES: hypothetical protein [Rhodobacterales]QIE45851.1 hypothetical protein G5B38_10120 [Pseudohalocynthiibacter aestuariivivens]UXX82193.1 hypothetical protein N7U68_13905 [Roseovarius pelagicus]
MVYVHSDPTVQAGVLDFVLRERRRAANLLDWQNALKNHGYAVQHTDKGDYVTTLPHGVEICRLPDGAAI